MKKNTTKTYIVYVKTPGERQVHDKRFDVTEPDELIRKTMEFFRYFKNFEIVRVEEVVRVSGTMDLDFGPNMIKAIL